MNRILFVLILALFVGCSTTPEAFQGETFVQDSSGWVFLRDSSVNKLYFYAKQEGLPHASLPYYDKNSQVQPHKFMRQLLDDLGGHISEADQQIFLDQVVDRVRIIQTAGK